MTNTNEPRVYRALVALTRMPSAISRGEALLDVAMRQGMPARIASCDAELEILRAQAVQLADEAFAVHRQGQANAFTQPAGMDEGARLGQAAGVATLNGCKVLVVEDNYYFADETRRELEKAGAEVCGPVANAADALKIVEQYQPDVAVLDLNLGDGVNFDLARVLSKRKTPFLFLTGYDRKVIPEAYANIRLVSKSLDLQQVIRGVCQLRAAA